MRKAMLLMLAVGSCGSDGTTGEGGAGGATVPHGSGGTTGGTTTVPIVVGDAGTSYFGDSHTGNFWLGPVDFAETQFHNACGPSDGKYPTAIQQLYGNYLMGLSNQLALGSLAAGSGQLCDVCAELAANGKTLIAHVITYGDETGTYDIDVSPEVDSALAGSTGRKATWRFVTCPTVNPIYYTFDGRQWTNVWFFRVWVRNARVPVAKLEYQLGSKAWATADWQSDGAWQASGADFSPGFSLRVTSIDGQTLEDALPGVGSFDPNAGQASHGNFQ